MKVLRIIAHMDPSTGGPCQGIRNTIPEMRKHGIFNEVVSLDDPTAEFLGKDDFPIHALGPAKGPWAYSGQLLPWLADNLHRFDAVIAHGLWLYPSYAARKALRKFKKDQYKSDNKAPEFYIMPHGMLDPYFQRAKGRKLKAIRNRIYWKLIESKVITEANAVLFTCEEELLLARKAFRPYKPKAEINIGYGIQQPPPFIPEMQEEFQKTCPKVNDKKFILYISRIHEKKGVDNLINAYAELIKNHGNSNIPKLVIAGPGLETEFGKQLLKLVHAKNLNNEVLFPGMLRANAKWGAFYACEAFILPSHQENFGIAVVEALACGKPVLISNKVNIWREIEESGGGIVNDDTNSGTEVLLRTWLDLTENEKKEMTIKALDGYKKHFAISANINKLINALNN